MFRVQLHTCQRLSEGSNKTFCAPGPSGPTEVWVSECLLQRHRPQWQGLWLQQPWITQCYPPESRWADTHRLHVLYQGNSHTAKTVLGPTTGFLTWIWRRDREPPGSLTLEASGIYSHNFNRTREADSWRAQRKPCAHQEPGEKSSVPTGERVRLACECPGLSGGDVGWQFGLRPQKNNREGTQPHPSSENQMKDLLSMSLIIRTRPCFPHSQSLPSESFHKPLILFPQRADRMKTTVTEN